MDLLDFHQHDQEGQDFQDFDDLPPFAPPLQRQDHWEPEIPMMRVSELKERLSAALNRTNTPLASNETRALREVLDKLVNEMSEGQVLINDDYPVPPILLQIEAIPFEENRGIRGNGGSRKRSYRKRSYRKRSYRKRSYRKKRGGSRRARMRSSFKKRTHRKHRK
jgi:hypothetical protein